MSSSAEAPHQQTPLSPSRAYFDDNSEQYRFCCCHVRKWTIVIGVLGIVFSVLDIILAIVGFVKGRDDDQTAFGSTAVLATGIVAAVISLLAYILLLYGVKKEKRYMLLPFMIMAVINIIWGISMAIYVFIQAANYRAEGGGGGGKRNPDTVRPDYQNIGNGLAYLMEAGFQLFFLYPVIRCYRYLVNKWLAFEAVTYVPMSTSYAAVEK